MNPARQFRATATRPFLRALTCRAFFLLVRNRSSSLHSRVLSLRWKRGLIAVVLLPSLLLQSAIGQVIINEILARNDTILPLRSALDYAPDYIELYNAGTNDVDLGLDGWSVAVERDKATNYFSVGTVIEKESFLLIFCDKNTNLPGYHTFFNLEARGDTVTLRRGAVTNEVLRFGLQIPDYAIGRVPGANTNSPFTLIYPSPCGGTIPCTTNTKAIFVGPPTSSNRLSLKINEWVANDTTGIGRDTNDWFEVYNPSNAIVQLSGLVFADAGSVALIGNPLALPPVRPLSFIGPLGYIQMYANGGKDADEVDFSLSSTSGDQIFIYAADRATQIDHVTFGPQRAPNISRGRIPDGEDDQIELPSSTPRESNFGRIDEILITEILTHTDLPLEDAVEFHNVTTTNVNVGGWWLSNQRDNPKKYRIPGGTVVAPGHFLVIYQYQFNGPTADQPFTFNSANGDECWLFRTKPDGSLTGYLRGISFGPAQNGVSFCRYVTSAGDEEITASSALSFGTSVTATDPPTYLGIFRTGTGATNPPPRVGPVVISEIHYHPSPIVSGTNLLDDSLNEFIEIFNASNEVVPLYDPRIYYDNGEIYADGRTNTWRLRGEVDYEFPAELLTIPPKGFVLVVHFDPVTNLDQVMIFRNKFPSLPMDARLFGPYRGELGNSSGDVDLRRPDVPQGPGRPDFRLVPYITEDRVVYNDHAPWPSSADGGGHSLQRKSAYEYGNDPINWAGNDPTPGRMTYSRPNITTQPASQTVNVGQSVSFSVTATGSEPLSYHWFKDGTIIPGATNAYYSIPAVADSDAGTYSVVVTDSVETETSTNAALTVLSVPVFTTHPLSQTVGVGSNLTLSASAYGAPPLVFQWYFNDSPVGPPATDTNVSFHTLTNIQTNKAGNYRVRVFNGYGSATSSNAALSVVVFPPRIEFSPSNQNPLLGGSANFTVSVTGTPPFRYQWQFNGAIINGATNASYTIQAVTESDSGNYSVVVANSAGSATSGSAILSVIVPPTLGLQILANYPLLSLTGMLGSNFTVQYNGNLAATNWINLRSISNLSSNPYQLLDTAGSTRPGRYYRAVMQ